MLLKNLFIKLISLILRLLVWLQSIKIFQTFQSVYQEKTHKFIYKIHISVDIKVLMQDDTRYADGNQIALVNFGSVALFSEAKLTTSSGKHLEKVNSLHIISIMHKHLTSQQQTTELMYGFEESVSIRKQELTYNKTEKGTFLVNIKLIYLFAFADQEKVTYGLGYTLTLKRNNNNDPIIRTAGVDAAKFVIKDIGWHILHFTPSLENQQVIMDQ